MFDKETKIPMMHVNIRLPKHVLEHFRKTHFAYTKEMRNIIIRQYEEDTKKLDT